MFPVQMPITLWDLMKLLDSRGLTLFMMFRDEWQHEFETHRSGSPTAPPADQIESFLEFLDQSEKTCDGIGLRQTKAKIGLIHTHVTHNQNQVDCSSLAADCRNILDVLVTELWTRKFVEIPSEYGDHAENEALFGPKVKTAFQSASEDIKQAGNCLAVECGTAAVFHLMRVAEFGLRALARDRRVQIPKKVPLVLGTWEDIIRQLEIAEAAIQGYPKTIAREAQYDFYHGAMMEFKRFKNKFRNVVMHNRYSYDPDEAASAFNHVRSFMVILSSAISESKRTPVIWKRDWSK